MTKAIEQDECFYRRAVSFRNYALLSHNFDCRFVGFIPENFKMKLIVIASGVAPKIRWNKPIYESDTIGASTRIKKLHFGFEVNYFREVGLLRSPPFTHDSIVYDKLRAIVPSFVENTDDYTKRVFACEPFSI